MISRRGLITGLIALVAAPAIIRTPGLLMPVRKITLISNADESTKALIEMLTQSNDLLEDIPNDWVRYTSHFKWNRGLIAEDWKYAIRISLPQQAWRQLNAHDEQSDLV
jgi:hypothetical protein